MLPKELQIDSHCARVIIVDESRECCSLGLKLDRLGHLGSQLDQVVRLKGGISQPDFFRNCEKLNNWNINSYIHKIYPNQYFRNCEKLFAASINTA